MEFEYKKYRIKKKPELMVMACKTAIDDQYDNNSKGDYIVISPTGYKHIVKANAFDTCFEMIRVTHGRAGTSDTTTP